MSDIHPTAVIYPDVKLGENVTIMPFAVVGRPPKGTPAMRIQPEAHGGTVIGDDVVIGCHAVIYSGSFIGDDVLIGDGVTIREDCTIDDDVIIGNNSTLQQSVVIGKRSRIVDLSHITAWVNIGKDVFWSVGVLSMNDNAMGPGGELNPPVVRSGAKIGGGAMLLPGVEVGHGAVVGSGAVVTRDVAMGDKVMGIPARHVGSRELPTTNLSADDWELGGYVHMPEPVEHADGRLTWDEY